jgi:hypothetical protein
MILVARLASSPILYKLFCVTFTALTSKSQTYIRINMYICTLLCKGLVWNPRSDIINNLGTYNQQLFITEQPADATHGSVLFTSSVLQSPSHKPHLYAALHGVILNYRSVWWSVTTKTVIIMNYTTFSDMLDQYYCRLSEDLLWSTRVGCASRDHYSLAAIRKLYTCCVTYCFTVTVHDFILANTPGGEFRNCLWRPCWNGQMNLI